MKNSRSHILLVAATIASVSALGITSAEARKIRTKHSVPKSYAKGRSEHGKEQSLTISMSSDSLEFCDRIRPAIRFYGFDKTVTGNMESFFISNGLDKTISGIEIVITYTDLKGRQLHKRSVSLDCDLPSGETKRFDIKSWDTQKSFYFHKSVRPKRQATPFDVRIELISVTYTSLF